MKNAPLEIFFGFLFIIFLALFAIGIYHYKAPTPKTHHISGHSVSNEWSVSLAHSPPDVAASILRGANYFQNTPELAKAYVGNTLSCNQCHLNGGQQNGVLGLVGVAPHYPEWDERSAKKMTLSERIQSCFLRSENGKAPPLDSPILKDLVSYVESLRPFNEDSQKPWRNLILIPKKELLSLEKIDISKGKFLFDQQCSFCHGNNANPQVGIPPLWGSDSFNDGAGLARVYTLASFIQGAMPLGGAQSLSDEEAQEIAGYVDSQNRPHYSEMQKDYPQGHVPVDAVYYLQRYPTNPLQPDPENKYRN